VELKKMSKSTITDPAVLMKQIESMRSRGYFSEREEFDEELTCVAVPLKVPELNFIGGISISGPIYRLDEDSQMARPRRSGLLDRCQAAWFGCYSI